MSKKQNVKETEFGINDDNFNEVMPKLEPKLKDGDKVNITSEAEITEDTKIDLSGIMSAMGINIFNKNPEEKADIKSIITKTINVLKSKGYANIIVREDDEETAEIDSLYSGADDRAIEYGIQNEDFDEMMNELKKNGSPSIKVNENINPRIKKNDLINYLKNKK